MSFFSAIGDMLFGNDDDEIRNLPNPAHSAMPFLNRIPKEVGQYYQPFINRGEQAYGATQPVYNQMSQNPTDFINQIMRNYTPSEGYKFKEKYLTQAARNSAAQGGFAGTPIAQMEEADIVRGLLGEEMQQYLANILGVQGAGLQGHENRINQGFQAGIGYGDILGTNLGNQAQLGFQGQAQQNANVMQNIANRDARTNSLLNFLGNAAGTAASIAYPGAGSVMGYAGGGGYPGARNVGGRFFSRGGP